MKLWNHTRLMTGALLCGGLSTMAMAQDPANDAASLRSEIESLKAQLSEVRANQDRNWLTERRAEEVKALVHEVLSDADTRASLQEGGMTAGHNGDNFYLSSADGAYYLALSGQLQVRYIMNFREDVYAPAFPGGDDTTNIDGFESGFQVRRLKFRGKGHIADPKIKYGFSLAGTRNLGGGTLFEDYYLEYKFDNGVSVRAGRFKQPFALQNLVSSAKQMGVDRSLVLETFNVDRSEGIQLAWNNDVVRLRGAFNDGRAAQGTDFNGDATDFGLTGRVDIALLGADWKEQDDFSDWKGDSPALFLGAAVHYQQGEADNNTAPVEADDFGWTVDALFKNGGLSIFGAVYGQHVDDTTVVVTNPLAVPPATENSFDNYGAELGLAYMVVPGTLEPYVKYEYIDVDDDYFGAADESNVFTVGLNWYQKKHDAKFTVDLVYADETIAVGNSGIGILADDTAGGDGQIALRAQYQLQW